MVLPLFQLLISMQIIMHIFLLSFDKYGHYTRISICKTKNNPLTLQANEQMYGEAVQFISDWYKP